ncbi:phage major capsid protein, HK97 family [Curtobacterium sp. UNCCL20]|uniref:phage major capsid protein n=1 Tax=Curtobacterium sp. UNCCL20 TaxID=1502773 RepID=UPI0008852904|nr:phage major capsid protein [Curtobacterium sp. UNCCL20]SDQ83232.1 phage major capsid protein, HK97 family [Curtobacterium sp. UNCCL20]
MDIKSAQAELATIQARMGTLVAEVKASGRDLTDAEVKSVESDSDRAFQLQAEIRGLKAAEHTAGTTGTDLVFPDGVGGSEHTQVKSAPRGFITPASLKATADRAALNGVKAVVAGGSTVTPVALDTKPVPLGQAGLGLLGLIPVRQRDSEKYSYVAQTVRTNNAAVVAPGAQKPTSVYTVKAVDGALKVYAHLSEPIDKMLLRDNGDLADFLDAELRNGIIRKLTADAVSAFSTASGIQSQAFAGTAADSIYAGASKITSLGHNVSVLVLPVEDYDAIRLSKDGNGQYLGGNPFEGGDRPGLWGMPTVASPDLPSGKALVLGQDSVGLSTDKVGVETEWNPYTYFTTNQVVARTEGRFGFDVFRPEAIALVTTKAA